MHREDVSRRTQIMSKNRQDTIKTKRGRRKIDIKREVHEVKWFMRKSKAIFNRITHTLGSACSAFFLAKFSF